VDSENDQRVRRALRRVGFDGEVAVERRAALRCDFVLTRGGERFVVVAKKARDLSAATLAEPLLRLRALSMELSASPLLVVLLAAPPTGRSVRQLEQRLADYRLETSWLLVDPDNGVTGRVSDAEVQVTAETRRSPRQANANAARVPFTDRSQWLLKHLVLGASPERGWEPAGAASSTETIPNANRLADLAGVSRATAYRLMQRLLAAGYAVRERWGAVRLEHPEALLEEWVGRYRLTDNLPRPYGPDPHALPPTTWRDEVLRRLKMLTPTESYALTAYAACELTGTQRTRQTATLHVYVSGDVMDLANRLDLVPEPQARGRDVVYLVEPAYPGSVFRGTSTVRELRVVDPLQAYLDLYHHFEAGMEQAADLFDRVIRPRIEAWLRT